MRASRSLAVLAVAVLVTSSAVSAQEPVHWDVVSKIREEGLQRSQVMDMVGYMSDVLGPRLASITMGPCLY